MHSSYADPTDYKRKPATVLSQLASAIVAAVGDDRSSPPNITLYPYQQSGPVMQEVVDVLIIGELAAARPRVLL
jgi:hypothetical protein